METRRWVWCETLAWSELLEPQRLAALSCARVGLILAVRPWQVRALAPTLSQLSGAGLEVSLWPMLDDAEGRWAHASNARNFCDFARATVNAAGASWVGEVVVDLEPPFALLSSKGFAKLTMGFPRVRASVHDAALTAWRALADELREAGRGVSAAVAPTLVFDRGGHDGFHQRWLGTPVDGVPWRRVHVMAYTSIWQGWSRGVLGRKDALELLLLLARRARVRWGDRAVMAIGAVGVGALGNEPVWRGVQELREDMSVVRQAGVDALSLFDLGGVVGRDAGDDWLAIFGGEGDMAEGMKSSRRARMIDTLLSLLGRT